MSGRAISAYQLSLLGDAPEPGYAWEAPLYTWHFGGVRLPLTDDALRQARLLRRESSCGVPPAGRGPTTERERNDE